MTSLQLLNPDFVLILQVGLLLLLATASWGGRQRDKRQPWRWFGWYAILQALRTVLDLAAYENRAPPVLNFLSDGLITGSSLMLIEFARASFPRSAGRWVHLPLVGGLIAALLLNGNTLPAWAGFVTAVLGGAGTAAAFWQESRSSVLAHKGHPLRLAALILLATQLLTALPDQYLGQAMPFLATTLPPVALRGVLVFILTLALLNHRQTQDQTSQSATQSAARSRRQFFCAALIVLLGIAGGMGADFAGRNQDKSMREQILSRTQIAAASVPAAEVSLLHWDERDLTNPAYIRLKSLMTAMRQANSDLRFVLLAGLREQRVFFLVDSENPKSEDYSPPGQSYDEATADYLAGLSAGRPFVLGPETDRWGIWIFGDAPIWDSEGRILAYLELDIAAADWAARIRHRCVSGARPRKATSISAFVSAQEISKLACTGRVVASPV